MELWLDMNLPPSPWIAEEARCVCRHFSELGLQTAPDAEVFRLARAAGAVLVTKDADYARLIRGDEPPPQVVWIRFGNVTNRRFRGLLAPLLPALLESLRAGEKLIEITEG